MMFRGPVFVIFAAAGQIWIIPLMHPEVSLYDAVKAFLFFMSPSLQ